MVGELMSPCSSVTIVASPRPRVGKTLLARLLIDFLLHEDSSVAGFDLNSGEGRLAQFLPEHAIAASVGDVNGQMAVFDRLIVNDGVAKVVDLGHESFASFFTVAHQIGFIEETNNQGIVTAVLFVLTPDASSVEAYAGLRKRFPQAMLVPAHNEILGPAHSGKYPIGQTGVIMQLPVLTPALRKYGDRPPFSFADRRCLSQLPPELLLDLQQWLRQVHIEFHEMTLRMLLADLSSAIRISS